MMMEACMGACCVPGEEMLPPKPEPKVSKSALKKYGIKKIKPKKPVDNGPKIRVQPLYSPFGVASEVDVVSRARVIRPMEVVHGDTEEIHSVENYRQTRSIRPVQRMEAVETVARAQPVRHAVKMPMVEVWE